MTDDWAQQIDRRLSQLETRHAVEQVVRSTVETRLHAIEDMLKWLVRLVLGALIMAITGYAIAGGFSV
ncbi:pseudouridine synthase [Marivivens niveibacter]|uniref:Pseudouridine synthase n=1 Tax=Marivivens niveibacter TaxID=1930667 RepID=A0A251WVU7_9RHOB|nr:pseudouridine synthase [Marivivens niveibacter]OUD08610.1 pseudouridine synthase [Marivivens niveibacter]